MSYSFFYKIKQYASVLTNMCCTYMWVRLQIYYIFVKEQICVLGSLLMFVHQWLSVRFSLFFLN